MKLKKRQKLCSNCEGDIDLDVIVCPYCAADLREERPERAMSQSLYPPPYPIKTEKVELPAAEPDLSPKQEEEPKERITGVLVPTLLFAAGSLLFLLGLLLLVFSQNGQVVLKWDARLWFLYLFASVPFLVFGYRAISKL